MKFGTLTIQNFGSIGELQLPLSDQGLVLILGRNEDAPKADSNGAGKALSLDTPILTSKGWSTMGDLVVGDQIFTPEGNLCSVLWKSSVFKNRPCYTLTFDEGTSITCDENHLWKVSRHKDRAVAGRELKQGKSWNTIKDSWYYQTLKTTKQLFEQVKWRTGGSKQYNGHNWAIENSFPLDTTLSSNPIIPGYLLGIWLGDGDSRSGVITCFDQSIIDEISCSSNIYPLKVEGRYRIEGLTTKLRKFGLLNNKHIPEEVLFLPPSYRKEVLQGLLDSDGTVGLKGYIEFSVTNKALAEGFFSLACTLGYKCSFREAGAYLYGRYISQRYRIGVLSDDFSLFRLERKRERVKINSRNILNKNQRRFIESIKKVRSVPTQCITVDSKNGMFLAGKQLVPTHNSLPLDAFTWALWGEAVRGFSTDEVVHKKVGKNCKVSVTFSDNGEEYKVTRLRRNTSDKDHKANDLILLHKGQEVSGASVAATQAVVEDLLGVDFVTFCAMMPGAGITVATMTDAQVKALLEKMLRTEVLGKASDEARRKQREVTDFLMVKNTELRDLNTAIADLESRIGSLITQEATFVQDSLQTVETIQAEIDILKVKLESLDKYAAMEKETKSAITAANNSKELLTVGVVSYKNEIDSMNENYSIKVNKAKIDIAIAEERIKAVTKATSDIASEGDTCPLCAQEVSEKQKKVLKQKKGYHTRARESSEKILSAIKAVWDHAVEEKKQRLHFKLSEVKKIEEDLKALKILKKDIDEAITDTAFIKAEISLKESNRDEHKEAVNPYTSLLEKERVTLSSKHFELTELLSLLKTKHLEADILSFWVDSFSPSGIRSFMLEHVTPLLNRCAKKYADLITDGEMEVLFNTKDTLKSGKVKERFNIQVSQKHGGSSYSSNSSGERARANLIISLALGELASLRAAKTIPFRFLDEPFESIDELGTEAIVTLLNQQKEQYNTVYVITHQDHLKQMFQKKLTIVKKDGYSSLESE